MQEDHRIDARGSGEREYTRRDFARMAALGAAATTIIGRRVNAQPACDMACGTGSAPDDEFCKVTNGACDEFVGQRCANFLIALKDSRVNPTVADLVYGSFHDVLGWLSAGEQDDDISAQLDEMQRRIERFNSTAGGHIVSLADLLTRTDLQPPGTEGDQTKWSDIYVHARTCKVDDEKMLRMLYPLSFIELENRNDPARERQKIKWLLFDHDGKPSDFRQRAGRYPFIDLYIKPASEVFRADPEKPNRPDAVGHRQIREAFRTEMFTIRDEFGIKNNDKCWSVSEGSCINDQNEMYCNDVGGSPSSSSDICP